MNIKVYYNNRYLLLTEGINQQTGNQQIIDTSRLSEASIKGQIENFIQHTEQNNLVFQTNNINALFKFVISYFKHLEAAGGLIEQNGKYLFIYRLQKWDLPKGKLDKGETPEQAAIRECEEECSITGLKITKQLPPTYHIYFHKEKFILKTTHWYLMETSHSGPLKPQTEENIEKVEWLDINHIKNTVLPDTYPSITELLQSVLILD